VEVFSFSKKGGIELLTKSLIVGIIQMRQIHESLTVREVVGYKWALSLSKVKSTRSYNTCYSIPIDFLNYRDFLFFENICSPP
jgi:hypothetical protein